MEDHKCPLHKGMEERLNKHGIEINEMKTKIYDIDKRDEVFNAETRLILNDFRKIPDVLESLKDTLISMQGEIKEVSTKTDNFVTQFKSELTDMKSEFKTELKDVKEDVKETKSLISIIDSEGKFNIRLWTKNNFPAILTIVGLAGMAFTVLNIVL